MAAAGAKPPPPPAYRLLAADDLGVLRVVEVPHGPKWADAAVVGKWGEPNKDAGATCLACSAASLEPGAPGLVAVGRKGRRVELLDAGSGATVAALSVATPDRPPADRAAAAKVQLAAVAFVQPDGDRPLQLVAAASDGMVSVCTCSDAAAGGGSGGWGVARSFQAGGSVTCMSVDASGRHLVVGGEGIQPSVWDLSTGARLWQAKGGKPDMLGLVDRAFTTALACLPAAPGAAAAAEAGGGGAAPAPALRFVAGNASSKVHVYDTAAGRRPQLEVTFGETRVTALAPEPSGARVWAANGTGHVRALELATRKLSHALKGAGGSVRGLVLHPGGEPVIASAGLDRFVRVHGTAGAASAGLARAYLKQQLTAVCWLPVRGGGATTGGGGGGGGGGAAGEPAGGDGGGAGGDGGKARKRGSKQQQGGANAGGAAGTKRRKGGAPKPRAGGE
ncbi:WDR74 [Scenedesmus sp. PABB004]|nr:WDR74 [Scenedesmus sp. PABB004]